MYTSTAAYKFTDNLPFVSFLFRRHISLDLIKSGFISSEIFKIETLKFCTDEKKI